MLLPILWMPCGTDKCPRALFSLIRNHNLILWFCFVSSWYAVVLMDVENLMFTLSMASLWLLRSVYSCLWVRLLICTAGLRLYLFSLDGNSYLRHMTVWVLTLLSYMSFNLPFSNDGRRNSMTILSVKVRGWGSRTEPRWAGTRDQGGTL